MKQLEVINFSNLIEKLSNILYRVVSQLQRKYMAHARNF